ncbi:MAG: hypothetical protein GY943_10330, partial [Chloroflexi bacterium]|nr:hypothetical protein [Chloroflexota bacterium]
TENVQVTLSPDFTQAELNVPLPYVYFDEAGELESVQLWQTAVYHKSAAGWQLAPPNDHFWGDDVEEVRDNLTLIYPARDAEFMQQFADELSNLLYDLCAKPSINCPRNFAMEIRFDHMLESVTAFDRNYELISFYSSVNGRYFRFNLPSPTLIGTPIDDVGYAALAQGYKAQVAAALIASFDPNCCQFSTDQTYLATQLALFDLNLPQPIGYQPQLVATDPPIPFPEQDVLMLCRGQAPSFLTQYQMAADRWQPVPIDGWVESIAGLDNGDGALVSVSTFDDQNEYQLLWLHSDSTHILVEADTYLFAASSFTWPLTEDTAVPDQVIIYYDSHLQQVVFLRLNESSCDETHCELAPIDYYPIVSPNKENQLLVPVTPDNVSILLQDVNGNQLPVGSGYSAVWLDDTSFMYVENNGRPRFTIPSDTSLVTAVLTDDGYVKSEVTTDDLRAYFSTPSISTPIQIAGIIEGSNETMMVPIFAMRGNHMSLSYLMLFDTESEEFRLLADVSDLSSAVYLDGSPNGRYIGIAVLDQAGIALRLYDLELDRWLFYPMPSVSQGRVVWSQDSNWLLLLEEDAIRFVAPDHNFDRRVFHEYRDCETAVWINK